jgi:hypothetical protein
MNKKVKFVSIAAEATEFGGLWALDSLGRLWFHPWGRFSGWVEQTEWAIPSK